MIECTDLFEDAEWACAHVMQGGIARINIQPSKRNTIYTVHIRIDSIANFLDQCRRTQNKMSDSKAI
jgi:hypothetical protein